MSEETTWTKRERDKIRDMSYVLDKVDSYQHKLEFEGEKHRDKLNEWKRKYTSIKRTF